MVVSEQELLNATEQDTVLQDIALVLAHNLPPGWQECLVTHGALGAHTETTIRIERLNGPPTDVAGPEVLGELFARLRTGMYRPGVGTWFSARFRLTHPVEYRIEYDNTGQPDWSTPPPPEAYAVESRTFPRDHEHVPQWLRRTPANTVEDRLPDPTVPRFQMARVFDSLGPGQTPQLNRPPVPDDEIEAVADYLTKAPLVLAARSLDNDLLDPARPSKVPLTYLTDGSWIWPGGVGYYLRTHGVPPEPELVEHIRRQGFQPPEVDDYTRDVAVAAIMGQAPPPRPVQPEAVPHQPTGPGTDSVVAAPPTPSSPLSAPPVAPPTTVEQRPDLDPAPPDLGPPATPAPPPSPPVATPPVASSVIGAEEPDRDALAQEPSSSEAPPLAEASPPKSPSPMASPAPTEHETVPDVDSAPPSMAAPTTVEKRPDLGPAAPDIASPPPPPPMASPPPVVERPDLDPAPPDPSPSSPPSAAPLSPIARELSPDAAPPAPPSPPVAPPPVASPVIGAEGPNRDEAVVQEPSPPSPMAPPAPTEHETVPDVDSARPSMAAPTTVEKRPDLDPAPPDTASPPGMAEETRPEPAPVEPPPGEQDKQALLRLRDRLTELGVDPESYGIEIIVPDAWCLVREGAGWAVFLTAGGDRAVSRAFPTADQAAAFMLGAVLMAADRPYSPAASSATKPDLRRQERTYDGPIVPLPAEPPVTLFRNMRELELVAGTEIDRIGDPGGNLTYAAGTHYSQRSLPTEWADRPYHVYRLQQPLRVLIGTAVPWFDQPGGGTGYFLPVSVAELVADGTLVEIEPARK